MVVKFIRYENHVKMPERAYPMDTGADIYMPHAGIVDPHSTAVFPLGFGIDIPNGYNARMQVRTSIAQKGIIIQGCAIDAGYTGELHMIIHNVSDKQFSWGMYDRLGYIEVYPCQYVDFVEDDMPTRGNKCFGSTGK